MEPDEGFPGDDHVLGLDGETGPYECPLCPGAGEYLGSLSHDLGHYRCRSCGWIFSQ